MANMAGWRISATTGIHKINQHGHSKEHLIKKLAWWNDVFLNYQSPEASDINEYVKGG